MRTRSSRIVEHKPSAIGPCRPNPPDQPQDGFAGAAVLKGDHVANFVANVHIHLVCHAEGELHRRGLVDLRAHHAAVLVVDGEAILGTPLRNLSQGEMRQDQLPLGEPPRKQGFIL